MQRYKCWKNLDSCRWFSEELLDFRKHLDMKCLIQTREMCLYICVNTVIHNKYLNWKTSDNVKMEIFASIIIDYELECDLYKRCMCCVLKCQDQNNNTKPIPWCYCENIKYLPKFIRLISLMDKFLWKLITVNMPVCGSALIKGQIN